MAGSDLLLSSISVEWVLKKFRNFFSFKPFQQYGVNSKTESILTDLGSAYKLGIHFFLLRTLPKLVVII